MRKIFLLAVILLACQALYAQPQKDADIVMIRERKYKLVEMPNGDKVPFVNLGSGNTDYYFENGRVIRKVFLDLFLKPYGHTEYKRSGDSVLITMEYNKEEVLKEKDSVLYRNDEVREYFHEEHYYEGPKTWHTVYFDTGSLERITTIERKGVKESIIQSVRLDSVTTVNINYDQVKGDTTTDTIRTYRYPDKISRLVTFRSARGLSYTISELDTNSRGHLISVMTFYNQDSVGDHIESILRHVQYKDDKPLVLTKSFFYGYWVMMNGMRYWQFLPNGKVRMTRLSRERVNESNWGWDEARRQVYIVVSEEDKKDLGGFDVVGNRLYLKYDPVNQLLIYGDNEYQKRPVLKRPKRDEAKVKQMIAED